MPVAPMCQECGSDEDLMNKSFLVDHERFAVYLECPECGWRLIGEVKMATLDKLPPLGQEND